MQRDLFIARAKEFSQAGRSVATGPVSSPGKDGTGRDDHAGEMPEEQSSHDPKSTPLNCAFLVIAHGEQMGFKFSMRGRQLIVFPAKFLSEDDKVVIRHFKKDLINFVLLRDFFHG